MIRNKIPSERGGTGGLNRIEKSATVDQAYTSILEIIVLRGDRNKPPITVSSLR
jgi:hypothetical protein